MSDHFNNFFKTFGKPILLLILLLFTGSIGYKNIEGWDSLDSIFMTLITLTTVGFGEVHPLSPDGKIFTMFLLFGGVLLYAITINSMASNILDYSFGEMVERIKLKRTITRMENHYIICGGGRMAYAIGKELTQKGESFVFIENNPESVVSEFGKNWPIIQKDALIEDSLLEAGIERAKGLASVLPTDADNLFVVLSARRLNPGLFIQTRISMESTHSKMLQAGADKVVSPYTVGGLHIARGFTNPMVNDFLSIVTDKANYEFDMLLEKIEKGDPTENKTIQQTNYREKGFIIIAIRLPDGSMIFAPKSGMVLKAGSELYLLGSSETS